MYKGTTHYVVVVSSASAGAATKLSLAVLPQNLDVWAWEKYYRAAGPAAPAGAATLQANIRRCSRRYFDPLLSCSNLHPETQKINFSNAVYFI